MSAYNPDLWEKAKNAKVGDIIICPACQKEHRKRSYQHKFCCTKCKDNYWNDEPSRRAFGAVHGFCDYRTKEEIEEEHDDNWYDDDWYIEHELLRF